MPVETPPPFDVPDLESFYNHNRTAATGDGRSLDAIATHNPSAEVKRWLGKLSHAYEAAGSDEWSSLVGDAVEVLASVAQAAEAMDLALVRLDREAA